MSVFIVILIEWGVLMNEKQLSFLLQIKRIAESNASSSSVDDLCNETITFTHSMLKNFGDKDKLLLTQSLTTQGYLKSVEVNYGRINEFTITPEGLMALGSGLKLYGTNLVPPNIEINTQFITSINELVEEIRKSNVENRDIWLEIAETLKEEVNIKNPKKNLLALLVGFTSSMVSFSANASTVLTASGVTPEQVQSYIKMLIAK